MSKPPTDMPRTFDLLRLMGFTAEPGNQHRLIFKRRGLDLSAVETMNRHFAQIVLISGHYAGTRTIAEIEIQVPQVARSGPELAAVMNSRVAEHCAPDQPPSCSIPLRVNAPAHR